MSAVGIAAPLGTCSPRGPSPATPPRGPSLPPSALSLRRDVTGIVHGTATSEQGAGSPPWGRGSYTHCREPFLRDLSLLPVYLLSQSFIYVTDP